MQMLNWVIVSAVMATANQAAATEAQPFKACPDCPEMVVVPAGTFMMGANGGEEGRPEGPIRKVNIKRAFALATHEVTFAQFDRFARETDYRPSGNCRSWNADMTGVEEIPGTSWRNPSYDTVLTPDTPVTCVSWTGAKAYISWLNKRTGQNYRLPTEAEWEYAARAGSTTEYPWGDRAEDGCAHANLYDESARNPTLSTPVIACNDGHPKASPVKSLKPNAFGVYDMIGNVWEWTQDCYFAPYPAAAPTDGSAYEVEGECPRRSVRGGSWISNAFRDRSAWRGRDPENLESWIFGFRVAHDVTESMPAPKK